MRRLNEEGASVLRLEALDDESFAVEIVGIGL